MQQKCKVDVRYLPTRIKHQGDLSPAQLPAPGLLYLPNPYVVPGGRFNEMYGWDSYFILLGELTDNRLDLARGLVDNFFYELDHYGAILNANRTYYLTRSQPPFLSSMVLELYRAELHCRPQRSPRTSSPRAPVPHPRLHRLGIRAASCRNHRAFALLRSRPWARAGDGRRQQILR